MKKLNNCKWFVLGIAVCLVCVTMVVPAIAAAITTKNAQLEYSGMKISLNGNAVTPKDANGNVVDPFVIDGTTYLPVRAIGSALGMGVDWDRDTNTVKLSNSTSNYAILLNSCTALNMVYQRLEHFYNYSQIMDIGINNNTVINKNYKDYFDTIDPHIGSDADLESSIKSVQTKISSISTSDQTVLKYVEQVKDDCASLISSLNSVRGMRSAIYRMENGYSDGNNMFLDNQADYVQSISISESGINRDLDGLSQEIINISK